MIKEPELVEAVNEVHAMQFQVSGERMLKLLFILVNKVRMENDNVDMTMLQRNQGKLDAYKEIKDYIERGIPTV
jgi:S-adenosylmethionine:diacylglycerol 3-amino-3-carboxypropyl transferase